jgi:hypothetical protein
MAGCAVKNLRCGYLPLFILSAILCVSLTLAQTSPAPEAATGIEGTISARPARGGPERAGVSSSVPLAKMEFAVKRGDEVVTTFQTDDQGHFRVVLPAGHYTVLRKNYASSIGSYGPFPVEVSLGKMTSVHWECDTGLR